MSIPSARNLATWGLLMALPIGWLRCLALTLYAPKEAMESKRGGVNLDFKVMQNARHKNAYHIRQKSLRTFLSTWKIISSLLMLCIVKISSIASYSCPWATTQCTSLMTFPYTSTSITSRPTHGNVIVTGTTLPCSTLNRKQYIPSTRSIHGNYSSNHDR